MEWRSPNASRPTPVPLVLFSTDFYRGQLFTRLLSAQLASNLRSARNSRLVLRFAVLQLYQGTVALIRDSADSASVELSMQFEAAVMNAAGVTFAVVIVKPAVISNSLDANSIIAAFQKILDGKPVVLMAQDGVGSPTYYGRCDITGFMATVPVNSIPWKKFTLH
jgi:hypothetical protein